MTALAAGRDTPQMGRLHIALSLFVPLAAAAAVFVGGMVCVNTSGFGVAGSASQTLKCVGIANETVSNAGGAAGKAGVQVERGVFKVGNSAGVDAITAADLHRDCYIVDDQTVARTSSNGVRPVAGRIVEIASDGVWVEFGGIPGNGQPIDLFFVAAADLSAKQNFAVKKNGTGSEVALAGAGEMPIGVLQNAPVATAIAIVRVSGVTLMIAGAAVAIGDPVASDAAGKGKPAVKAATNTSDAGGATDALIGSYVLAIALTAAAADTNPFQALITHSGAVPTTAA